MPTSIDESPRELEVLPATCQVPYWHACVYTDMVAIQKTNLDFLT